MADKSDNQTRTEREVDNYKLVNIICNALEQECIPAEDLICVNHTGGIEVILDTAHLTEPESRDFVRIINEQTSKYGYTERQTSKRNPDIVYFNLPYKPRGEKTK